jgi:hypothetical protein
MCGFRCSRRHVSLTFAVAVRELVPWRLGQRNVPDRVRLARRGGRSCHFGAFNDYAMSKYYGSMLDTCNSIDSSGCNGATTWGRCA